HGHQELVLRRNGPVAQDAVALSHVRADELGIALLKGLDPRGQRHLCHVAPPRRRSARSPPGAGRSSLAGRRRSCAVRHYGAGRDGYGRGRPGRTPFRATPVRPWRCTMRVWVLLLLALLPAARAVEASIMEVRPGAEDIVSAAGQPGGPFTPSQVAYTV